MEEQYYQNIETAKTDLIEEKVLDQQESKKYLKSLRTVAGRCSLILLILVVVARLFSSGISYLLWELQKAWGYMPVSSGMATYLTSYFPCLLADVIAIVLGTLLLSVPFYKIWKTRSQETSQFSLFGTMACIGAGNIGAFFFFILLFCLFAVGYSFQVPELTIPNNGLLDQILCLSYICVLGPVCEEILFRGIILKSLKRFGKMTAIIASSVLFAMFHMNPVQFFVPILVGLVLGFMTVQSKSIFPAIVAHIANNTLRTLPTMVGGNYLLLQGILNMIAVACTLASMIGLLFFILRYGRKFTDLLHHEDISLASVGKKLWNITHAGWSVVYLLTYLAMSGYILFALIKKV